MKEEGGGPVTEVDIVEGLVKHLLALADDFPFWVFFSRRVSCVTFGDTGRETKGSQENVVF